MARWWILIGGQRYCHRGNYSTCYRSRLYIAADDASAAGLDGIRREVAPPAPVQADPYVAEPHIRVATREINEILSRLERDHAGPDRTLAFVVLPDGDDDILGLDWIYHDQEIITSCDQSYVA